MKKLIMTTFSLALLAAGTAFAQGTPEGQADIPFQFHVGDAVLPAGHYVIYHHYTGGLTAVRGQKTGAMILTVATERRKPQDAGSLVFHRYGHTYFLSKVWASGSAAGHELRMSKTEKEFASNSSPAPITVALGPR